MKADVYSLKRKPRAILPDELTKLTTRYNDGFVLDLSGLRVLGKMEQAAALNHAESMIAQYVTGYGETGSKSYSPPQMLPPVDGEPVFISESTAHVAAIICRAQTTPQTERYSFEELVSFMVDDDLLEGMVALVPHISPEDKEEKPSPLASTPSGEASSDTASTEEPQATPTLSPTSAPPSGASTNDLEPSLDELKARYPNLFPDSTSSD